LEDAIQQVLGETGLMLFVEFDHGMILRKGTERHMSKIIRLVLGNPPVMKEMAKHVPDAGSYAPVTVLVDERVDGVHLSYDRMASLLASYNPDATGSGPRIGRQSRRSFAKSGWLNTVFLGGDHDCSHRPRIENGVESVCGLQGDSLSAVTDAIR
jgi:hypothetical protein